MGGNRPEGDTTRLAAKISLRDVSSKCILDHHRRAQQPVSSHRPKLFFGQITMLADKNRSLGLHTGLSVGIIHLLIGDSGNSTHDNGMEEQQLDLFAHRGAAIEWALSRSTHHARAQVPVPPGAVG